MAAIVSTLYQLGIGRERLQVREKVAAALQPVAPLQHRLAVNSQMIPYSVWVGVAAAISPHRAARGIG